MDSVVIKPVEVLQHLTALFSIDVCLGLGTNQNVSLAA